MLVKIIRIETDIVNCCLEDGQYIDVAKKWFPEDISEGDELDFDVSVANEK